MATYVSVNTEGNLYVSDTGNRRIQKLSPDGTPLAQWGTYGDAPGQFRSPSGIAVDAQGNIFVADLETGGIQKLSPDGQPLAAWGRSGSGRVSSRTRRA